MRAVKIDSFGPAEHMRYVNVPDLAEPDPGQVQIRMVCASVNPADWKCRAGHLVGQPNYNPVFPMVLGFDGAGVVERVGPGVRNVRTGQRVMCWASLRSNQWGTYAEFANVEAEAVAPIPDSMRFEEAAAVPIAGMTVWQDLFYPERGNLRPGQTLFLHGGSGGMGSYGVQFARASGVRVAASCSGPNVDYVRSLGAEQVLDYRTRDLLTGVRAWAPEGVDVVLDAVGMGTLPDALRMLRPGGILVRVATLGPHDLQGPSEEEASRLGVRVILARRSRTGTAGELERIIEWMARGQVRTPPLQEMPIESVVQAHQLVEQGHVRGKIVLRIATHG